MKNIISLLSLSATLVSCCCLKATEVQGPRLFPNGTYVHFVKIIVANKKVSTIPMRGVVTLQEDTLKITGLSPIGSTIFKISDTKKDGEPKVEIFSEELEPMRPHVENVFKLMRQVLRSKERPPTTLRMGGRKFSVEAPKYDAKNIPQVLTISNKEFAISIEVLQYELAPLL